MLTNKQLKTEVFKNIDDLCSGINQHYTIKETYKYYDGTGYRLVGDNACQEHMFIRYDKRTNKAEFRITALHHYSQNPNFFSELTGVENNSFLKEYKNNNILARLQNEIEQQFNLAKGICKTSFNPIREDSIDIKFDITNITPELVQGIRSILNHYGLTTKSAT